MLSTMYCCLKCKIMTIPVINRKHYKGVRPIHDHRQCPDCGQVYFVMDTCFTGLGYCGSPAEHVMNYMKAKQDCKC